MTFIWCHCNEITFSHQFTGTHKGFTRIWPSIRTQSRLFSSFQESVENKSDWRRLSESTFVGWTQWHEISPRSVSAPTWMGYLFQIWRWGLNFSWWRHQLDTFPALLTLCAGISPITGEFPSQRPLTRSFDAFIDLRLNKRFRNNREAGDLRRHRAHYDVNAMYIIQIHLMDSKIAFNERLYGRLIGEHFINVLVYKDCVNENVKCWYKCYSKSVSKGFI